MNTPPVLITMNEKIPSSNCESWKNPQTTFMDHPKAWPTENIVHDNHYHQKKLLNPNDKTSWRNKSGGVKEKKRNEFFFSFEKSWISSLNGMAFLTYFFSSFFISHHYHCDYDCLFKHKTHQSVVTGFSFLFTRFFWKSTTDLHKL